MKKRVFILLLIVVLLLTGCGSRSRTESRREVAGRVEIPAATEVPAATEAPVVTEVPEETEASVQERPISLGRMEGGNYINEYAGYGCSLDDSWVFYSAEELQEMPEMVKEATAGTELGDALDPLSQFTDVMAENADMLVNFNVLYRKMTMEERLGNMMLSEKEMIEGILDMQDQMIEAYAQGGILVDFMEAVTVTFLGQERTALHTVSSIDGIPYFTLQVFDSGLGSHAVTLTLASFVEDNTFELLDLFYAVS